MYTTMQEVMLYNAGGCSEPSPHSKDKCLSTRNPAQHKRLVDFHKISQKDDSRSERNIIELSIDWASGRDQLDRAI